MYTVLNSYFDEKVKLSSKETKRILRTAKDDVEKIIERISEKDSRFSAEPVGVGSYYQYLQENQADEFDLSIPLKNIGPLDSDNSTVRLPCFEFDEDLDESIITLRDDLKINWVEGPPQHDEEVEFVTVSLRNSSANEIYKNLTCSGFLMPYYVKLRMKELINEAIRQLKLSDSVSLGRLAHGPALTLTVDLNWTKVNFDLAAVIQARIPFQLYSAWKDRAGRAGWPQKEIVEEIDNMGIDLVAKENFYWTLSFARCDKALVSKIDKDGSIRRKVHRIMKSLRNGVAKSNGANSKLTTYMMKNAWLLVCEILAGDEQWQPHCIYERYNDCMIKLQSCLHGKCLPVYFCREINLLRDKTVDDIQNMLQTVAAMRERLRKYWESYCKEHNIKIEVDQTPQTAQSFGAAWNVMINSVELHSSNDQQIYAKQLIQPPCPRVLAVASIQSHHYAYKPIKSSSRSHPYQPSTARYGPYGMNLPSNFTYYNMLSSNNHMNEVKENLTVLRGQTGKYQ